MLNLSEQTRANATLRLAYMQKQYNVVVAYQARLLEARKLKLIKFHSLVRKWEHENLTFRDKPVHVKQIRDAWLAVQES